MKKIIFLGVLVFIMLIVASVDAGSFQWVENPHPPQQNRGKLSPEKDLPITEKVELYNVLPGPIQDDNFNRCCVSYSIVEFISVPPEGASFYLKEYYRIKGIGETEWGEWEQTDLSSGWYLNAALAATGHIKYRHGFWIDEGVSFGPSEAEFKTEIYSHDNELLDTFITPFDNGYWQPRLESEDYDDMPSVVTPTPTPVATPTPTPAETGSISGTVANEKSKPLANAKVSITAGNFFSDRTKTDGNGEYSFKGLNTQKEYSITAKKSGYQPEIKNVYLEGEATADFSLQKK